MATCSSSSARGRARTCPFEPQFIAGYNFQERSKASVTIGNKSFSMFTRGKSAWVENAAEEPQLIAAMKTGHDMKVAAKSGRGNPTTTCSR